jgi:hypothetical protein
MISARAPKRRFLRGDLDNLPRQLELCEQLGSSEVCISATALHFFEVGFLRAGSLMMLCPHERVPVNAPFLCFLSLEKNSLWVLGKLARLSISSILPAERENHLHLCKGLPQSFVKVNSFLSWRGGLKNLSPHDSSQYHFAPPSGGLGLSA